MDSNPNQACDTDSSHSLHLLTTIGFGILQLRRTKWMKRNDNSQPIDSLPTKFLKTILRKLTWSQLAHLRVVCKRWRAVIHSMGEEKKLLIFNDDSYARNLADINLKMLTVFPPSNFKAFILGLFPSVDQLVFRFSDQYPIGLFFEADLYLLSPSITSLSLTLDYYFDLSNVSHRFANHINLFTSLTRLELSGNFVALLPLLGPTLRRVESFSYSISDGETNQLVNQLVRQFGRNCTRFSLDASYTNVPQWRVLNPLWLNRLTHLYLSVYFNKFKPLARFLSVNAVSLQVLHFVNGNVTLTAQAMDHLSRLAHLVELTLNGFYFETSLPYGTVSMDSRPLVHVRTCTLRIKVNNSLNGDVFSRILSAIFSNVQHLDIYILNGSAWDFPEYLDRFPALRTHKFR